MGIFDDEINEVIPADPKPDAPAPDPDAAKFVPTGDARLDKVQKDYLARGAPGSSEATPLPTDAPVREPVAAGAEDSTTTSPTAPAPAEPPEPDTSSTSTTTSTAPRGMFADEIDEVIPSDQAKAQAKQQVAGTLAMKADLAKVPPDTAREVLQLAQTTGLPQAFVAKNLDLVRQKVAERPERWAKVTDEAPVLAQWAADSTHRPAAVADDLEHLSTMQRVITDPWHSAEHALQTVVDGADAVLPFWMGSSLPNAISDAITGEHPIASASLADPLGAAQAIVNAPEALLDAVKEQGAVGANLADFAGLGGGELAQRIDKSTAGKDYGATTPVGRMILGSVKQLPMLGVDLLGQAIGGQVASKATLAAQGGPENPLADVEAGAAAKTGSKVGSGIANGLEILGQVWPSFRDARDADGNPLNPYLARAGAATAATASAAMMAFGGGVLPTEWSKRFGSLLEKVPGARELVGKATEDAVAESLAKGEVLTGLNRLLARHGGHVVTGALQMGVQAVLNQAVLEGSKVVSGQPFDAHLSNVTGAFAPAFEGALRDMFFVSGISTFHDYRAAQGEVPAWRLGMHAAPEAGDADFNTIASEVDAAKPTQASTIVLGDKGQRVASEQSAQRLRDLVAAASQSKTQQSAPADVAELLQRAGQVPGAKTHAFIDKRGWDSLWQTEDEDPAEAAKKVLGDNGEGYADASTTGDAIAVPLERLAKLASEKPELAQKLIDHARLAHDESSPAELRAQDEELRSSAKAAAAIPRDAMDEGHGLVFDDYRAKAEGAGRSVKEAEANAKIVAGAFHAWAQRFQKAGHKVDAWDLYQLQDVTIWGKDAKGIGLRENPFQPPMQPAEHSAISAAREEFEPHLQHPETEVALRRYLEDPVTGLRNQRAADLDAEQGGKVLHFAIEGTKYRNDDLKVGGHHKADELLRAVGEHAAALDPKVWRAGGDFAVRVPDEAAGQKFLEDLRARMPEEAKRYEITGAVRGDGEEVDAEGKPLPALAGARTAHGKANEALEKAGQRAERGKKPLGLGAGEDAGTTIPSKRVAAELGPEHRQHFADLISTDEGKEEAFQKIHVEPKTGLLTKQGWNALPRKKFRASIDLNGLKRVQEKLAQHVGKGAAHAFGDRMLERFGRLASKFGGLDFHFTHDHGDEYLAEHDDEQELQKFLSNLREFSKLAEVHAPDAARGGHWTYRKLIFGYGIGEASNERLAEQRLNEDKERLLALGDRGTEDQPGRLDYHQPDPSGSGAGRGAASAAEAGGDGQGARDGGDVHPARFEPKPPAADGPGDVDRRDQGTRAGDDRSGRGSRDAARDARDAAGSGTDAGPEGAEEGGDPGQDSAGGPGRGDRPGEGAPGVRGGEPAAREHELGREVYVAPEVRLHPDFTVPTTRDMALAEKDARKLGPERRDLVLRYLDYVKAKLAGQDSDFKLKDLPRDVELHIATKYGIADPVHGLSSTEALRHLNRGGARKRKNIFTTDARAQEQREAFAEVRNKGATNAEIEQRQRELGKDSLEQPARPGRVQRIEAQGASAPDFTKPHGIYTTPAEVDSPHADLGGTRYLWDRNPDAHVLSLPTGNDREVVMRRGASDAGAGVYAAKELLGREEFLRIKQLSREKLQEYASTRFPGVDWGRYHDKQEVMEGLGGMLAREKGYDAIEGQDADPRWSEYIGLTPKSMTPIDAGADKLFSRRGRGRIDFTPPGGKRRSFDIHVLASADESTLAHETAHFLSEVMGDLARLPGAPQDVKDDYSEALKFMGYDSHEQRQVERKERNALATRKAKGEDLAPDESKRLKHLEAKEERFAVSWEQYLAEGKTPSLPLARVFARFREWMKDIYQRVEQIGANFRRNYGEELGISDAARKLFARILAGSDAVDQARASVGAEPAHELFDDASPEERAAYEQTLASAREQDETELTRLIALHDKKETNEVMKESVAKIRAQEQARADADPVHRVVRFLQRGDLPEHPGKPPEYIGRAVKLDRKAAEKAYGKDALAGLPPRIFAKKGEESMPADELAEHFGFPDGRQLLLSMHSYEPAAKEIEARVEQRVKDRFGGPLIDDGPALAEAALNAVHNPDEIRAAMLEHRRLAAKVDPARARTAPELDTAALRRIAREKVAKLTVDDLMSGDEGAAGYYRRAERTAAERMRKAYAAGKVDQALAENTTRLLNMHLWRAARDAREDAETQLRQLRQANGDPWQVTLGKADVAATDPQKAGSDRTYRDAHNAILEAVGVRPASSAGIDAPAFEGLMGAVGDDGVGFDPAQIRELLAQPKRFGLLSPDEAENVAAAVKSIHHAAGRQVDFDVAGKQIDKAEAFAQLRDLINGSRKLPPGAYSSASNGLRDMAAKALRGGDAWLVSVQNLVEDLDGGNRDGPAHRILVDGERESRLAESRLDKAITQKVVKAIDDLPKKLRNRMNERVQGLAELLPVPKDSAELVRPPDTRRELWMLFLNAGNDDNRQRLRDGNGWSDDQVNRALQLLEPEEAKFLQSILDTIQGLHPDLARVHERRTGIPLGQVKARPIEVRGETYRGGYFPIRYHAGIDWHGVVQQSDVERAFFPQGSKIPSVFTGHTKAREQVVKAPLSLEFGTIGTHLAQVVHDIAMGDWVRTAGAFIMDDRFTGPAKTRIGAERVGLLKGWMRDIASERSGSTAAAAEGTPGAVQVAGAIARSTVIKGIMGANIPSILSHLTDPLQGILEARGPVAMAKRVPAMALAYLKVLAAGPHKSFEALTTKTEQGAAPLEALSYSKRLPFLESREEANVRRELAKFVTVSNPVLRGALKVREVSDHYSMLVRHKMDVVQSRILYLTGYQEGIAQGMTPQEAGRRGDDLLEHSLPVGDIAERAAILRSKSGFSQVAAVLYGYANKMYNLNVRRPLMRTADAFAGRGYGGETASSAVLDLAARWLVMGAIGSVGAYLAGRGHREDEDEKARLLPHAGLAGWLVRRTMLEPALTLPVLGSVSEKLAEGHQVSVRTAPEMQLVSDSATRVDRMIRSAESGQGNDADVWTWIERATDASLGTVGQSQRTFGYLHALHRGQLPKQSGGDVAKGLLYGPPRTR